MATRRSLQYAPNYPRSLSGEVLRTELLSQVDRAHNANLIILAAPSGYGKSTLLGQIVRRSKQAAWLTLTERHADLEILCNDLIAALGHAIAHEVPAYLSDFTGKEDNDLISDPELLARALDQLTSDLRVCIDQTHLLGDEATAWLEAFALSLGEGHQLLYSTYELAAQRLARSLASGQTFCLGAHDLVFSKDETQQYLRERGSSEAADAVHQKTEGWPAGVSLVASGVSYLLSTSDYLFTTFERLPEPVKRALPEASVLDVWSEEGAAKVGCTLPSGWLKVAQRAGMLMVPLGDEAYRPHSLTLELLDRELKKRPERYHELHKAAAHEAEKRGNLMGAFHHYRRAGLSVKALPLLEVLVRKLNDRTEMRLLCNLVETVELADLVQQPYIGIVYGQALYQLGNVRRAEEILTMFELHYHGGPMVHVLLANIALRRGDAPGALIRVEKAFGLIQREAQRLKVLRLKASILSSLGRLDQALLVAQEALVLAEASGEPLFVARSVSNLGEIHQRLGAFRPAEEAFKHSLSRYADLDMLSSVSFMNDSASLAEVYNLQGRFNEAYSLISRTLALPEATRFVGRRFLLTVLGHSLLHRGIFGEAAETYQQALELHLEQSFSVDAGVTRYYLFDALRQAGRLEDARSVLDEARTGWSGATVQYAGYQEFYEGIDTFSFKNLSRARTNFSAAVEILKDPQLVIRAHAHLLELDRLEGQLHLEDVAALVEKLERHGSTAPLWADVRPLKDLYASLLERGWFVERFRLLMQPRQDVLVTKSRISLRKPLLRIQTLGSFQVALDNEGVSLPLSKTIELLV